MPHQKAIYFSTDARVQSAKNNIDQADALYKEAISQLDLCDYCGDGAKVMMEEYANFLETHGRKSDATTVRQKIRGWRPKPVEVAPSPLE